MVRPTMVLLNLLILPLIYDAKLWLLIAAKPKDLLVVLDLLVIEILSQSELRPRWNLVSLWRFVANACVGSK